MSGRALAAVVVLAAVLAVLGVGSALLGPGGTLGDTAATPTERLVDQPDPDHPILVVNERETTVNVTVSVAHRGSLVFLERFRVAPTAEPEVYNLARADPDGIEPYNVTVATDSGHSASYVATTDACLGSIIFTVRNGSVDVGRDVC